MVNLSFPLGYQFPYKLPFCGYFGKKEDYYLVFKFFVSIFASY